ncbi:MAG: general secretion pathway protein GspB [Rhodoferax sp.]|uniref:general secretion pathway protein GspB n=1 Tax=Rhodoferax sp. TaxID=50421 RepID=UPI002623AE15|nr:general secretion pathway protein GspB [Rhodoferax sp.]MDD5336515.1 general secretion pathway protein GspB [Rhodoferax sp.]
MSYILDALKRADAERERGAVPGLYARQLTNATAQTAPHTLKRFWLAGAAIVALGVAATALWLWRTPAVALPQTAVQPAVSEPKPPAPLTQALALPPPEAAPAPAPQPMVPLPAPVAAAAPAVTTIAPAKPAVLPTPSPLPVAKASAAAPAAVALLGELPEDLRRQIPPLVITGAVYSESPGQRLLLVNNQVLAQGSLAAPEVNLEEIGAKSSVFSFRGTRFRLAH